MDKISENTLGHIILNRVISHKINFEVTEEVVQLEKAHVSNYFRNPEKNWGPKRAAAIVIQRETKKERYERENMIGSQSEERKIENMIFSEEEIDQKMMEENASE
jgi:hypothetical protein